MAKKHDVRKVAANLNSPWLKSALKSMGITGHDVIKEIMPATVETIDNASRVAKDTARSIRSNKASGRRITDALENTQVFQAGKEYFRNAIQDIKSGNLQNKDRDMFGGSEDEFNFDFDDFDMSFDDMGEDENGDSTVNVGINQNIVANQNSNSDATIKMIQTQTRHQIKSTQVTIDSMVSLNSNLLMKMDQIGSKVLDHLGSINSNIAAMVEYNNENMTKFIEASIAYYEQTAPKKEDSYSSSDRVEPSTILTSGAGLDFDAYKRYIIGNIKDIKDNTIIGSVLNSILQNKDYFLSNPIGMLMTAGVKGLVPKVIQESMTAFDNAFKDLVPTILERIADLEGTGTGIFRNVNSVIANVFGARIKKSTEVDFKKIETGPMPYNGMANHSIVEIIPKYLRESNSYLREIATALTNKTDEQMTARSSVFDWEEGKFTTAEELQNKFFESVRAVSASDMENSEFGKRLTEGINYLKNDKDKNDYTNALRDFYSVILQQNGQIRYNDPTVVASLLDKIGYSDDIKKVITAMIEDAVANDGGLIGSANVAKMRATTQMNRMFKQAEDSAPEYYNMRAAASKMNYDKWVTDAAASGKVPTVSGSLSTSSVNMSIPSLIMGIQKTLDRGIFVSFKHGLDSQIQNDLNQSGNNNGNSQDASVNNNANNSQLTMDEIRQQIENDRNAVTDMNEYLNDPSSQNFYQRASNKVAGKITLFTNVMKGIMAGNADKAWNELLNGFGDMFHKAGEKINESFLQPIKTALIGQTDDNGYRHGGILEGFQNKMKESFYVIRHSITGQGYTDSDGNYVADASGDDYSATVVGKLKNMVNTVKEGIHEKLFGKETTEDEDGKEGILPKFKKGITGVAGTFYAGLLGWKKALFGDSVSDDEESEEEAGKKTWEEIKAKAKDTLPNAIIGTMAGAGGGLAAGGILGSLVGGPIGGALLGFAGGILSKSDKFNNWLFGPIDEESGDRTGGVISAKMQKFFSKNKKFLTGGASLGAVSGLITGGGILGSIVGGPIAGALIGLGSSMVMKSELFQKFIYGDPESGQIGLKQSIKKITDLFSTNGNGDPSGGKMAGMLGIGAAGGGLLGLLIGGPVVGASIGLGVSMLAEKDNFHEWLFGKTDKETGIRREGVLGQFRNMVKVNVFEPMTNTAKDIWADAKTFFEYQILNRLNLAFEPIAENVAEFFSSIKERATILASNIGSFINENILKKGMDVLRGIVSPIASAVSVAGKAVYGVAKTIVKTPVDFLYGITSPIITGISKLANKAVNGVLTVANSLIIKPINTLVVKPITKIAQGLGKVIQAPFTLLSKVANKIDEKVVEPLKHVGRFVGRVVNDATIRIGDKIATVVTAPFRKAKDFADHVKLAVQVAVSPLTNFVKSAITEIKNTAKDTMKRFLGGALKIISAPFKFVGNSFKNVFGGIGKALGIGEGYFGKIWKQTAIGGNADFSDTVETDENGRVIGSKISNLGRRRANDISFRQKLVNNRAEAKARRDHNKNAKLIAKYTKNQRADDTEENRRLAEMMSGRKLAFRGDAVKTGEEKVQEAVNIQTSEVKKSNNWLKLIYHQISAKLGNEESQRFIEKHNQLKAAAKQARVNAREEAKNRSQEQQSQTVFDRLKANFLSGTSDRVISNDNDLAVDEKFSQAIKNGQSRAQILGSDWFKSLSPFKRDKYLRKLDNMSSANITKSMNGAEGGILKRLGRGAKTAFKEIKAGFGEINRHALGGGATPGYAIVGEEGPEAIYGSDPRRGKLVGLNGPEVIRMHGGETVIPNEKLPAIDIESVQNGTIPRYGLGTFLAGLAGKAVSGVGNLAKNAVSDVASSIGSGIKNAIGTGLKAVGTALGIGALMSANPNDPNNTNGATISGGLSNTGSGSASDVIGDETGEKRRAQHEAEEEKQRVEERENNKLETLKNLLSGQTKHSDMWDSIFSKKGLITGALIVAIPLLMNFLKNADIGSLLGAAGSALGNIGESVGNVLNNAYDQWDWTNKNHARTDGKSSIEVLGQNVEDVLTGNVLSYNQDGTATHQTAPRANLLLQLAKNTIWSGKLPTDPKFVAKYKDFINAGKNGANTIIDFFNNLLGKRDPLAMKAGTANTYEIGANGIQFYGGAADDLALNAATFADDVASATIDNASTFNFGNAAVNSVDNFAAATIDDAGQAFVPAIFNNTDNAGAAIVKSSGKASSDAVIDMTLGPNGIWKAASSSANDIGGAAAKLTANSVDDLGKLAATQADDLILTTGKNSKLCEKVCSVMSGFVDNAISAFSKKSGAKTAGKFGGKALTSLIKGAWKEMCEKIAQGLAKIGVKTTGKAVSDVLTAGLAELVFAGLGALNGITGTAKLFHVSKDTVDSKMRTISAIFGAVAGTTVGSIVDVVLQVIYSVTGVDWLNCLATEMYNSWATKEDQENLAINQSDFQNMYLDYQEGEMKKQFETQKAAGMIDKGMSFTEFKQSVASGDAKVAYDSFADYNMKENASVGDKIMNGLGVGLKGIGKGLGDIGKTLVGGYIGNKSYVDDATGTKYIENEDGTFQVIDSKGKDLGFVAKEAVPEGLSENRNYQENFIKASQNTIIEGIDAVKDGLKDGGITGAVDNFSAVIKKNFPSFLGDIAANNLKMVDLARTGDIGQMWMVGVDDSKIDVENPVMGILKNAVGQLPLFATKIQLTPMAAVTSIVKHAQQKLDEWDVFGKIDRTFGVLDLFDMAKQGDVEGISNYAVSNENDSPVMNFIRNIPVGLTKGVALPIAGIVAGAKAIVSGAKWLFNAGKSAAQYVGKPQLEFAKYQLTGDMEALNNYQISEPDENIPAGGMLKTIVAASKFLSYPMTALRWVGNKIGAGIVGTIQSAKQLVPYMIGEDAKVRNAVANGSIEELSQIQFSEPPDIPGSGFVKGLLWADKLIHIPSTALSWVGHKIGEWMYDRVQEVASIGSDLGGSFKNQLSYAVDGDITGLMTYHPTISENNPIGGFSSGLLSVTKFTLAPLAGLMDLGNQVGGWLYDKVQTVKQDWATMSDAYANVGNYVADGDVSGLAGYTYAENPDSPVSGFGKGIFSVVKGINFVPAALVWAGKTVADYSSYVIDSTKNEFSTLGSDIASMYANVPEGDPLGALTIEHQNTDSPLRFFANGIFNVSKLGAVTASAFAAAGKVVVDYVSYAVDSTKTEFSNMGSDISSMFANAKSGDVAATLSASHQETDSPLRFFANGIFNVSKLGAVPVSMFSWAGDKISDWMLEKTNQVKAWWGSMSNAQNTIKTAAASGDFSAIWNAKTDTDNDGNPISGIGTAAVVAMKLAYSAGAIYNSVSTYVKAGWNEMISSIKGDKSTLDASIANMKNASSQGKPESVIGTSGAYKSGISGIFSGIEGAVKAVLYPIALMQKVMDPVEKGLNSLKQGWDNLISKFSFANTFNENGGSGIGPIGGRGDYMSSSGSPSGDTFNGATYFSQNDSRWANDKYIRSDGIDDGATMADTGCGPTAMAMVINDIKRRPSHTTNLVTPTELAGFAQDTGSRDDSGTNAEFIDTSARAYGLDSRTVINPNADTLKMAIQNTGHPIVLLGSDTSNSNNIPYTANGHYIVATGVDNNGNIMYNDPRGKNYSGRIPANRLADNTSIAWAFNDSETEKSKQRRTMSDRITDIQSKISYVKSKIGGKDGLDRNRWISIVKAVKAAMAAVNPTYNCAGPTVTLTVDGKTCKTRPDCSGLVAACLYYYGVLPANKVSSIRTGSMGPGENLSGTGFSCGKWPANGYNGLTTGDIVIRRGHTQIFAGIIDGKPRQWNGGSTKSLRNPDYDTWSDTSKYTWYWTPGSPGADAVTGFGATTDDTSGQSNTKETWLSKVTTGVSNFASALFQAALTGDFNINWDEVFSSGSTSSGGIAGSSGGWADGAKEGKITPSSTMSQYSVWNSWSNKSEWPTFFNTAKSAGLTPAEMATVASLGIFEDSAKKIFGKKSLTNTTYDYHGQRAQGIMNWVGKENYGNTVGEQLSYIKNRYFSATGKSNTNRSNSYWDTDNRAFASATGRSGMKVGKNQPFAPEVLNSDLVEGSFDFYRSWLVPECIHTTKGAAKHIGTAADIYNYLLDNGYATAGSTTNENGFDSSEWVDESGIVSPSNSSNTSSSSKKSSNGIPYAYYVINNGELVPIDASVAHGKKVYKLDSRKTWGVVNNKPYEIKDATTAQIANAARKNGGNGIGGRGDGPSLRKIRYSASSTHITPHSEGNDAPMSADMHYTNNSSTGKSSMHLVNNFNMNTSNIDELMRTVIEILGVIANNSTNLTSLNDIKNDLKKSQIGQVNSVQNKTINNINPGGRGSTEIVSPSGMSQNEQTARRIAFGT